MKRRFTGWDIGLLLALAAAYFLFPNARLDFTRFNAHDSESYIALASSLVEGRGYTRSFDADIHVPHTTWPPGMPLFLAPSVLFAGHPIDLLLIKINVIVIGLIGIALSAAYANRVTGSPMATRGVIVLLGLNPYYWHFSRIAMTEVPAYAWAVLSLLLVDIAWRGRRPSLATAFWIGVICGFGMLIRGSLLGIALLPLAMLLIARPADTRIDVKALAGWISFGFGFVVLPALWALRNHSIDTTGLGFDAINQLRMILAAAPTDAESPLLTPAGALKNVMQNLAWHIVYVIPQQTVPGLWTPELKSALGSLTPVVAALLTLMIVLAALGSRAALPITFLIAPMAVLYVLYAFGGSARFWTSVSFLLVLAFCVRWGPSLDQSSPRKRGLAIATIVVASGLSLAAYIAMHERMPYMNAEFRALAELYDDIAARQMKFPSVYAPNQHAFRIRTDSRAPMEVPGRGIDPPVSHAVLYADQWKNECLPAHVLMERAPWVLVELSSTMPTSAVRRATAGACVVPREIRQ